MTHVRPWPSCMQVAPCPIQVSAVAAVAAASQVCSPMHPHVAPLPVCSAMHSLGLPSNTALTACQPRPAPSCSHSNIATPACPDCSTTCLPVAVHAHVHRSAMTGAHAPTRIEGSVQPVAARAHTATPQSHAQSTTRCAAVLLFWWWRRCCEGSRISPAGGPGTWQALRTSGRRAPV